MTTQYINFTETDLASRLSAGRVRLAIEDAIERNERVILDFAKVESISESYADELIGVLVSVYSLARIFERVELKGLKAETAHSFASVIRHRLKADAAANVNPLLVVREALRRKQEADLCI